jgi:hypothetical protein
VLSRSQARQGGEGGGGGDHYLHFRVGKKLSCTQDLLSFLLNAVAHEFRGGKGRMLKRQTKLFAQLPVRCGGTGLQGWRRQDVEMTSKSLLSFLFNAIAHEFWGNKRQDNQEINNFIASLDDIDSSR